MESTARIFWVAAVSLASSSVVSSLSSWHGWFSLSTFRCSQFTAYELWPSSRITLSITVGTWCFWPIDAGCLSFRCYLEFSLLLRSQGTFTLYKRFFPWFFYTLWPRFSTVCIGLVLQMIQFLALACSWHLCPVCTSHETGFSKHL